MPEDKIILLGRGGHGASCAYLASKIGITLAGYADDDREELTAFQSLNRLGDIQEILNNYSDFSVILGIGDHNNGLSRVLVFEKLMRAGIKVVDLISPGSNYGDFGFGKKSNQCFNHSYFGADCMIGRNNIFNTGSIIEHQSKIGSHCHIGPGAVLSGNVLLGDQVTIGANATVLPGLEINSGNIIGAGTVVNKSIYDSGGIYVGNPATKISDWNYNP